MRPHCVFFELRSSDSDIIITCQHFRRDPLGPSRRLDQFEEGTDFGKWLRGIARFLVANERRKEVRRSRLLPFAVVNVLLEYEAECPDDTEIASILPAMEECVEELPSRSREMLRQRYGGDDTATALAKRWGISAEAVRQQLMRIRVAVKECIERKIGCQA